MIPVARSLLQRLGRFHHRLILVCTPQMPDVAGKLPCLDLFLELSVMDTGTLQNES